MPPLIYMFSRFNHLIPFSVVYFLMKILIIFLMRYGRVMYSVFERI